MQGAKVHAMKKNNAQKRRKTEKHCSDSDRIGVAEVIWQTAY